MISWKYSFEKISKDLELAKKKKEALDDLFNSGKISASTYESLEKELTDTIVEIEARKKDLTEKISSKITDLEKQISTLELFLANSEIQYVAGEIDEESHANEIGAFTLGLDAVKQQLSGIKEVITELMPVTPEAVAPTPPPTPSEVEEAQPTQEVVGETTEIPFETPVEEMPVEETTEVESVSEEVTVEETLETPTEEVTTEEVAEETTEEAAEVPSTEEAVETLPETPAEEMSVEEEAPSEGNFEEPVITEFPAETVDKEAVTEEEAVVDEEETDVSVEEERPYEEEATTEEVYENY